MVKKVCNVIRHLTDFLYPASCLFCREEVLNFESICAKCWNQLPFIREPHCSICSYSLKGAIYEEDPICFRCRSNKPNYDFAYSLLEFNKFSQHLIHGLKFYDRHEYSQIFAKLILARFKNHISDSDIIVPVPMHKIKRLIRLYNHSQILAMDIGHLLEKKNYSDILIKSKHTRSQSSLGQKVRAKNLIGSIKVQNNHKIKGKKILLVDDVITTGATIDLCARELKKSGAKNVIVLSIARRMLQDEYKRK